MQKNLAITAAPHLRSKDTTASIMRDVCIALVPAGVMGIVWFGSKAAILIAICVAASVLFELLYQKLTHQKVTVGDLSAVVTGLLLAYNLPATAPWWMAVIGSFLAIILVKQIFGGIGCNFMNPALTARAILFVSWGTIMGVYPNPDTVTGATPLAKIAAGNVDFSMMDLLIGKCGGVLGETCKIALIVGGVYLLIRKVISWEIPVSFILTAFVAFLIKDGANVALMEILSGGLLLGAIFMATDYVTSPVTSKGKLVFGFGCGILLFVIRAFATLPEGCSFAILFMNVCTPLIDRLTGHKSFGEVKTNGK